MTWPGFSDAELEAASSRGLLRRAGRDVEAGLARLNARSDTEAEVAVEDAVVTLTPGGIKAARCTCPSREVCRHKLAAALLLRELADAAPPPPPGDPVAEIKEMTDAVLEKALGKTALREGARLLGGAAAEVTVDGNACRIGIPGQPEVLFMAGGGIAGMVSKAPAARAKALHAAALLAVRGGGEAGPATAPEAAAPPDPAFLAEARTVLLDATRSALGPAPRALEDRLLDLAISSRAGSLPALASLLRQAAVQVAGRRNRDLAWDPAAALNTLARAAALTQALGRSDSAALRGVVRQAFEPMAEPLDLVGCGVEIWRSATGARGATAHLYSPALDRWFGATLGRPAGQDPGFDPAATAWRGGGVWGHHLAEVARSRLVLTGAAASATGRLSLGQDSQARLSPPSLSEAEVESWPGVFSDWTRLEAALASWFSPSLAAGGGVPRPVLLRPAVLGRLAFDEVAQLLVLPVRDQNSRTLGLTLDVNARGANALAALAGAAPAPLPLLAATASVAGGRFALQPFAAWNTAGPASLALEHAPKPVDTAKLPAAAWATVPGATARLLAAATDELVRQCELGGRLQDPARAERLATLARRAEDAGLSLLNRALLRIDRVEPEACADAILAAVHVTASLVTLGCRMPYLG